ncbi:hypothetical protein BKA81DRAFT_119399 [Phyllosticta paracitricarpa]
MRLTVGDNDNEENDVPSARILPSSLPAYQSSTDSPRINTESPHKPRQHQHYRLPRTHRIRKLDQDRSVACVQAKAKPRHTGKLEAPREAPPVQRRRSQNVRLLGEPAGSCPVRGAELVRRLNGGAQGTDGMAGPAERSVAHRPPSAFGCRTKFDI